MNKELKMTDEQLEASLRSIGKTVFVNFFHFFQECYVNNKPTGECAEVFAEVKGECMNNANTRCSKSKGIFRHRAERRALEIIARRSHKLPEEVKARARQLLDDLSVGKN